MIQAPLYRAVGQQISEVANPEIVVGQIKNISPRDIDMKPMISVLLKDGTLHHNVDVLFNSSTNGQGYIHLPLEVGGYVYCLKTYENAPLVAIGGALKPTEIAFEQALSVAADNSDRKAKNIRDLILYNDGNTVNLTHLNGVVIDSERTIRMQLGENAAFRISRYGASQDNVLDGSEFIDKLFAYIKELEDKINAQADWIKAAQPAIYKQFELMTTAHLEAAAAAQAIGDSVTAANETAEANIDAQNAVETETLSFAAAEHLDTTTEEAKDYAREALNRYVQTPYKG